LGSMQIVDLDGLTTASLSLSSGVPSGEKSVKYCCLSLGISTVWTRSTSGVVGRVSGGEPSSGSSTGMIKSMSACPILHTIAAPRAMAWRSWRRLGVYP
jgi:hypothetical protein